MKTDNLVPLDEDEAWALATNVLLTQGILLLAGIVLSVVACGVLSGDWHDAVIGFGWLHMIADSLTRYSLATVLICGCLLAAAFYFVVWLQEQRALKSEEGRRSVFAGRQGVNGEFPRLPIVVIAALFAVTGFAEELLFRFSLITLASAVVSLALPTPIATVIALFVSSVAFWFAHVRYRDLASTVLTLALGLALGIAFVFTHSLAIVALTHALYDLAVVLGNRRRMRKDPNYFFGPAPTRALLDQLDRK